MVGGREVGGGGVQEDCGRANACSDQYPLQSSLLAIRREQDGETGEYLLQCVLLCEE